MPISNLSFWCKKTESSKNFKNCTNVSNFAHNYPFPTLNFNEGGSSLRTSLITLI